MKLVPSLSSALLLALSLSGVQTRQLMLDCLDANGEHTHERTQGHERCNFIAITSEMVTKTASQKKDGIFETAREFYELETSIYERLQSVERPRACRSFILFPR